MTVIALCIPLTIYSLNWFYSPHRCKIVSPIPLYIYKIKTCSLWDPSGNTTDRGAVYRRGPMLRLLGTMVIN